MKKTILGTIAALMTITSAQAFQFRASARTHMDRTQVIVEVINNTQFTISCTGQAFGYTVNGNVANAWMNNAILRPGQFAYVYVYTNNYDPFRNASHNINCHSL